MNKKEFYVSFACAASGMLFGLGRVKATFNNDKPTYEELNELAQKLAEELGYNGVEIINFIELYSAEDTIKEKWNEENDE